MILGAVMRKGFAHDSYEILTGYSSRLMIHAQRMEILDRGWGLDSRVRHKRSCRNEIVKGQEDIPDIEDDGLDLGHDDNWGIKNWNSGTQELRKEGV
jgi:hypothetical protein